MGFQSKGISSESNTLQSTKHNKLHFGLWKASHSSVNATEIRTQIIIIIKMEIITENEQKQ